ncbi:MAG: glycosyltransferase family 39 protein [Rudaea sp.]
MSDATLPRRNLVGLSLLAIALFILHMLCNGNYGFHRDELQVLDDARHLAWGYVAYPPLTPFLARIEFTLFGTSLVGFRVFSALMQCLAALLTGLIARELGGSRKTQLVAALAAACMPFSMLAGSQFMYVSPDFFWWVLLAWLTLRLINSGNGRWWLAIGCVIGLGMMTRYTMLFAVAGLIVGVLATPLRKYLSSRWLWAGVVLSVLIFLPNLIWQIQHDFVYVDFVHHIHARDIRWGRTNGFFLHQLDTNASVFLLPLWLAGLGFLIFSRRAARYRVLAWIFVVTLLLFALARGRAYYMAPAYPMLLAAGAVWGEAWLDGLRPRAASAMRIVAGVLFVLAAASTAAVALPIAPVNSIGWRISRRAHDDFAEQIGWRELVSRVSTIYKALPAGERAHTGIVANNYGEAGAIDLYGPALGLPTAISGVNSYWYRSYPDPAPQTVIVLGDDMESMAKAPATCTPVGKVTNRYNVVNEETRDHPQIFICRDLRMPWPEIWKRMRSFG